MWAFLLFDFKLDVAQACAKTSIFPVIIKEVMLLLLLI